MASQEEITTLEWFGATTFRLKTRGLTIFLDTWLDRPAALPSYISIADVREADYVFISHAHFDHLPGADRLALQTGAIIVANCEAINLLAAAGVPEDQLLRVSGGERVPLFTKNTIQQAKSGKCPLRPGPPGAPPTPHPSLAAAIAHIWPSLHCLMPGGPDFHPEEIDSGEVFTGEAHPCLCTVDINRGMKYGLFKLNDSVPQEKMDAGMTSFLNYIADRQKNVMSHHDGGQLMVNFQIGEKGILWSSHLGAYEGIMKSIEPKPEVAIMGIAGRANLNGRPWDGSAAQFVLREVQWLRHPTTVIWCLHDESCIRPYRINTKAATELVETHSTSRILDLNHSQAYGFRI
ncbi:hypothetical protein COCVIDRAFT_31964 [Bipolaris victoriae FI3]|uniref:Metallo-beta-lactamase domain-containing protein n=1 Tax=Bipolaris victoriae (strain FI3) TaxID=930091 RepID=W7DXD8_BIPV3|nr:hypothetical protein COCVIDRAFT_31964 [Bipolaris victoriae FI3]